MIRILNGIYTGNEKNNNKFRQKTKKTNKMSKTFMNMRHDNQFAHIKRLFGANDIDLSALIGMRTSVRMTIIELNYSMPHIIQNTAQKNRFETG